VTVLAPMRVALSSRGGRAGSLLTRQGPLAGRYPAVAAMVIFALAPYGGFSIYCSCSILT
jgi:hypothetical protein